MYVISTYDKHRITITDEEAVKVLEAKQNGGLVIIRGNAIEANNISAIYREETEDRKFNNAGVLHDGSRVVRQFGQWFCDDGQYDEQGRLTVRPDRSYYPEATVDVIASPEEWELLGTKFYELHAGRIERAKLGTGRLESVGGLLGCRVGQLQSD